MRINWADAAVAAGMTDLYMTVYRETSSDAAHVSLKALERHVVVDGTGTITGFRFHPQVEGVADTLSQAIASLLHATEAKLLGLGDAAADEQLRTLAREWSGLVDAQTARGDSCGPVNGLDPLEADSKVVRGRTRQTHRDARSWFFRMRV